MFPFSDLKLVEVEITSRCQASCPMCARNIHGGPVNPNLKLQDWTLTDFKRIFSDELCTQITTVRFCGSFGDPVINQDLLEMCQHLKDLNPKLAVRLHTNGSARSIEWWKDLAIALPEDHLITFGIDGLTDTHSLHRIGTDYNKIIENAQAFIQNNGKAEWCFIKFKHNEHQITQAQLLAKEYGFVSFAVKNSIRFNGEPYPVIDKDSNVLYNINPPSDNVVKFVDKDLLKGFDKWFEEVKVDCHVLKNKEIYIDSQQHMYPCCWIASAPYLYHDPVDILYSYKQRATEEFYDVLDSLGGFKSIDLTNKTVKQVFEMPEWQSVWQTHWNDKILVCAKNCGNSKLTKPKDQVILKVNV